MGRVEHDAAGVVIVGAGHGGDNVAAFLRQAGYDRPVTVVGGEPEAPYHRPPLSKAFLAGADEQRLRPGPFYAEQDIGLALGTRAVELDLPGRAVVLGDGSRLPFARLVLATGAIARRLPVPGAERPGVHTLRSLADARALRAMLAPGVRLAVVGGGYVGLEVAGQALASGAAVTVLERERSVLARVAGRVLADHLAGRLTAAGATVLTGADVVAFAGPGDGGALTGLRLADGTTIACEAAVVGVGAVPDDALARAAGLPCDGGVIVDERGCVVEDLVYAVGDVTRRPVAGLPGTRRLESIPSAVDQARQVAAAIAGSEPPEHETPWFWSDQHGARVQICGLRDGADATVVRGDVAGGAFAVFHLAGSRVCAVEAVNAPAAFMAGKRLIRDRAAVAAERLADEAVPLRELAALTPTR